jgi:hypothetical protein
MTERSGPFWDAVLGRAPILRAAATLGAEFVGFDAENATIDLAFTATEDFTNPAGPAGPAPRPGARYAPPRGPGVPGGRTG